MSHPTLENRPREQYKHSLPVGGLARVVPQLPANVNGDSITVRIFMLHLLGYYLGAARIAVTDFSPEALIQATPTMRTVAGKDAVGNTIPQDMTHRWLATTLARTGTGVGLG